LTSNFFAQAPYENGIKDIVDEVFFLAYHSHGGLQASWIDTLNVHERKMYVERLVDQLKLEQTEQQKQNEQQQQERQRAKARMKR
jgi:hypothetical protein